MDEIANLTDFLHDRCPAMDHHNIAVIRGDRKNQGLAGPEVERYRALWRTPIQSTYRGYTMFTMPPASSGGIVVTQSLNILESWDSLPSWGSAAYAHLLGSAYLRAFIDRNSRLGDPDFVPVPLELLTSKSYAHSLAKTILPDRATPTPPNGQQIVDSAVLSSTDVHAAAQVADAQRALRGQQLILQLGADGTVESARDAQGNLIPRELADAMAAMPAVFPRRAVSVGDRWVREMPLPSGGPLGARGSAHVRATFHLDSLLRGGAIAYVSMRGEILPDSASHGVELSGSITGDMQLDRVRGWMTDSRILVFLKSVVSPPSASGLAPMQFITRVTQRLTTIGAH